LILFLCVFVHILICNPLIASLHCFRFTGSGSDGSSSSTSERSRSLALDVPAVEATDVFISLDTTVDGIHKLVEDTSCGAAVFIRAPVATGKSTLAVYLARKHPDLYIKVATGENEAEWRRNIIMTSSTNRDSFQVGALSDTLKELSDKTLIFDEAHTLFGTNLIPALLKLPEPGEAPKYLLFSAAAHGGSDGTSAVTPVEISEKYMWYPPLPDAKELSENLATAGVLLTDQSVDFFLKLCCGHRGVFMRAMKWVNEQQQKQQEHEKWNVAKSVTKVRTSLADSVKEESGGWNIGFRSAIAQSRAVRVNSKYSELQKIPAVFANVLAGGAKQVSELGNQHRALTIAGFVVPQQLAADAGEFVKYDWVDDGVRYSVANALMAQYYNDKFTHQFQLLSGLIDGMDQPTSCADLLARALPFMSFADVVDAPTSNDGTSQSPLSESLLPFEDHYNAAITKALEQLKFTVSNPQSQSLGKVDVFLNLDADTTLALECIMATRPQKEHKQHVDRFGEAEKTNYSKAKHKCVVTIGLRTNGRADPFARVNLTAADHGVDIIGLVVSQAHDSYAMYIKSAHDNPNGDVKGPFFFVCDRVAKSLQLNTDTGDLNIASAQELKSIVKPQEEEEEKHVESDAKEERKDANKELDKAYERLKEAKKDGDEDDVQSAKQGVKSALSLVTYWTNVITGKAD
jgi:hypothetical protein